MKTITRITETKRVASTKGKAQSRHSNGFRSLAAPKTEAKGSAFLFTSYVKKTKPMKLVAKSKEHLRTIVLNHRDSYL